MKVPRGEGLFAGTAWHYARYRPGYPQAFLDDLIHHLHLTGPSRLLDLGCGTGQLTLPLAPHVTEAVGMDPEPEMLSEAARQANNLGLTNVVWVKGNSADLPADPAHFTHVTMGRSFHWMHRDQVLTALDEMVDPAGTLIIANDSCLVCPSTPWQQAIEDIQRRFLPPDHQHGPAPTATPDRTHEQVLADSPFPRVNRRLYEFQRPWTLEQALGYLYSTSLPLLELLGDRRPAFEATLTDTLLTIEPTGHFTEPVTLEVLTATRT
ncbi:class I SAM-dependent methyltransferase [Nocardia inohanensis]|uniref:class I SAM-dependent methyltransferase n=1 Tax=Nocardia inohanensis TaxID=209246 RepID=UPI0008347E0E|nr:class I SAM-dependent methyltransferase [Nocardia inohanensis]